MRRRRPAEFASLRQIGIGGQFEPEVREPAGTLAVFEAWRRSTGEQMSRMTRPVEWDGRRLVVEVSDPVWLRHLDRMRDRLLPEVNAALAVPPGSHRGPRVAELILRAAAP